MRGGGTADGGESLAELADIYLAFAARPDDSQRAEKEGERGGAREEGVCEKTTILFAEWKIKEEIHDNFCIINLKEI